MPSNTSRILNAGEREASVPCTRCGKEVQLGESLAVCVECGAVHHEACWQDVRGCCAYECAGGKISQDAESGEVLSVTREELSATEPLVVPDSAAVERNLNLKRQEKQWNKASIGAFVVALLGIPLFGIITGLIAILIACIALVIHRENSKGMGLAIAALLIGLFDVVGWSLALSSYYGSPSSAVSLAELAIDPSALEDLPDYIARAMRANVMIQINAGFGAGGIGSGVVLKVKDDQAYIVTNRHVIDRNYSDSTRTAPENLSDLADIAIMSVGQVSVPAYVEWVAPKGIDLAIISAHFSNDEVQEAHWDTEEKTKIGDEVFAVGNPHGLGWTHTSGSVSQIRKRTRGGIGYRILQTSAPINPGNSGGGLYDAKGRLLGINTLTTEKRFGEGLGFSINFQTLIDLAPERFHISDRNFGKDD